MLWENHMKKSTMLGYGAASIADSGPYNFVTVFFILFLTTVAGLSPERAGTISSLVILLDGFFGAIIGYISDNIRSKYGRRRPFLLAAMLPLGIGLIFMFSNPDITIAQKTAVYAIAGVMFWVGFGMYYTPYTALGAEITGDYDERSTLRTYARFFALGGNALGIICPLIIVSHLQQAGLSEGTGWTIMAAIMAVVSVGGIAVTWITTRGHEKVLDDAEETTGAAAGAGIAGLFRDYLKVAKLKPFKYIAFIQILFILANTFYNSTLVFFARYELGVADDITSVIFLIAIISNLAFTPVAGVLSVRFDKKNVLAFAMLISGCAGILFFVVGIHSFAGLAAYAVLFNIAYSTFWQLCNALVYDMSEVAEFKMGRRIEGSITSVTGLAMTIGTSIATQLVGWFLKFSFIKGAFLLLPGIVLIAGGILQLIYPMNKRTFHKLEQALADKKAGRQPDTTGLERIL